jgi:hypothetical protein
VRRLLVVTVALVCACAAVFVATRQPGGREPPATTYTTYTLGAQTCQSYQSLYVHPTGLIECR